MPTEQGLVLDWHLETEHVATIVQCLIEATGSYYLANAVDELNAGEKKRLHVLSLSPEAVAILLEHKASRHA
jgi:hypothetical protein